MLFFHSFITAANSETSWRIQEEPVPASIPCISAARLGKAWESFHAVVIYICHPGSELLCVLVIISHY